jgi:glucose/mannose-6-phosphate isomerase
MDLDQVSVYKEIDKSNMLAELQGLPNQLMDAWYIGKGCNISLSNKISSLVIAGMGGSAMGADLLASYAAPICPIPILTLRDYRLPVWAKGGDVLVVASSHSGNTEETISVFQQALVNKCSLLVISTGGILARQAQEYSLSLWTFKHKGQPRAAVGYSFGLLLALLVKLGLIPNQDALIESTVIAMQKLRGSIDVDVPVKNNAAKRMAGQLMSRWITVISGDYLLPVARRYKTQINELAKAWAQFEFLPEVDHNTLAGIEKTEEVLTKIFVLFLSASSDHPRNQLRSRLTQEEFMRAGINTDRLQFQEENPLAEIWTCLLFGDFLAYYLAIAYQIDPTPIETIQNLKIAMQ